MEQGGYLRKRLSKSKWHLRTTNGNIVVAFSTRAVHRKANPKKRSKNSIRVIFQQWTSDPPQKTRRMNKRLQLGRKKTAPLLRRPPTSAGRTSAIRRIRTTRTTGRTRTGPTRGTRDGATGTSIRLTTSTKARPRRAPRSKKSTGRGLKKRGGEGSSTRSESNASAQSTKSA